MNRRLILAASVLVAVGLHSSADAETLTVCAAGCDWTTIQGAVNAAAAGDTVLIADSYHTEADILVFTSVTIEGVPGITTLQASEQPGQGAGRMLVIPAGTTVEIRDLTIRHGDTEDAGGAIHNLGMLTLDRVTLRRNYAAQRGGAIHNTGTLTIVDSVLSHNESNANGGAIANTGTGQLRVSRSLFYGNSASLNGGHILNLAGAEVDRTAFVNGDAVLGGGAIANAGGLIVSGYFGSNAAQSSGGAIRNTGALVVVEAQFSYNTADDSGEALSVLAGDTWVEGATFYGNEASRGGGIDVQNGQAATLVNSTLAENLATTSGGGAYLGPSSRLYLASTTLVGNVADLWETGDGDGGGIYLEPCVGLCSTTRAHLQNSIVANNEDRSPPGYPDSDDCDGELTSHGFNLIEGATTLGPCRVAGDLTGVQVGIDPDLGEIDDHGGPEVDPSGTVPGTLPPNPGSPVVDAGDPSGCTDFDGGLLPRDQRGALRVGVCDVGSFELGGLFDSPIFADGFESGDTTAWSLP